MADATPSRVGQINLAGDQLALFLKLFAGEVLTAFDRKTDYRSRHRVRTIPHGKSAQFPVVGLAAAQFHTPGTEITGQQIRHGERIINVEDILLAPVFIAGFDELMNHYDVRSIYSNEIAQALAKTFDKDVSRTISRAARAAANLTDLQPGTVLSHADAATDGPTLFGLIFDAGVELDKKDIPADGRHVAMKPVQYALVVRSEKPINTDLNPDGNGSLASGLVFRINGMPLFKTNNMAQEDDTLNTAIPALRRLNYAPQMAQVFHESAAGTVQLQDMTMESEYDIRRQGTLVLGKYLVGHDYLRPEAAVEIDDI
jgi:hypothetical protein